MLQFCRQMNRVHYLPSVGIASLVLFVAKVKLGGTRLMLCKNIKTLRACKTAYLFRTGNSYRDNLFGSHRENNRRRRFAYVRNKVKSLHDRRKFQRRSGIISLRRAIKERRNC